MKIFKILISLSLLLMISCSERDRSIQVYNKNGEALPNATISILPSHNKSQSGVSTAITNHDGIANFGTGEWSEINQYISIKITKGSNTFFDKALLSDKENNHKITIILEL